MIRLIYKEIRSSFWIFVLACIGAIAFTLLGNPFTFRGDSQDGSTAYFALIFFVLGLRSYSSEMKDNTIGFLYSRPIKWWQILIAKLIAGILGIALVLSVASLTYILTTPDQLRPFIVDGLTRGIPYGLEVFGLSYIVGFVVSALMPGIALSFASLVVALSVLMLPFIVVSMTGNPVWLKFGSVGATNASLLMGLGAFISTILVARSLPKLGMKERWLMWAKLPILGMVLACLLAAIHFNIYTECLPDTKACALSPNGRWALYSTFPDAVYRKGKLALVDTSTGRELWSASEKKIWACAWADDSSKFAYIINKSKVTVVRMGEKPSVVGTAKISFPPADVLSGWPNTHVSWKPDGSKLAVLFIFMTRSTQVSHILNVLDIQDKKVYVSDRQATEDVDILSLSSDQPVYTNRENIFWPPGFGEPAAQ